MRRSRAIWFVGWVIALSATTATAQTIAGVDPLTARVDDSPAQRFARLWRATNSKPSAAQIQAQYLDHGGRALQVFTPSRIVDAEHLATVIAKNPEVYSNAVERCLPWVPETNAELRSVYLGLKGLFPNRPLPQIALVIGANNSGGTAAPGIQVLGLEVLCRLAPTHVEFQTWMRHFFAHETVHTFQKELSPKAQKDMLLAQALIEGTPDLVSELVTAHVPDPVRDAWARPREAWIWHQFQADAAMVRAGTNANGDMNDKARAALRRWFENAGDPPKGWPSELGYWVGMRIAEAYMAHSANRHRALDELLDPVDPEAILRKSGYGRQLSAPVSPPPADLASPQRLPLPRRW